MEIPELIAILCRHSRVIVVQYKTSRGSSGLRSRFQTWENGNIYWDRAGVAGFVSNALLDPDIETARHARAGTDNTVLCLHGC